jgi:hypothetical protein
LRLLIPQTGYWQYLFQAMIKPFIYFFAWLFLQFSMPKDSTNNLIIEEITLQVGFGGSNHPDSLGGHGLAWADVTGNGFPDLYVTMNWKYPNIAYPELFYINKGKEVFEESANSFGIDDVDGGSHGAVFADLNNNGYFDLVNGATLNLDGSAPSNKVYMNREGKGFELSTPESMLQTREFTRGVGVIDINNNGLLDIICVSGWKGQDDPESEKNEIYLNLGGFKFEKLDHKEFENATAAQGVTVSDIDGNGYLDVLSPNMGGEMVILLNHGGELKKLAPGDLGIKHKAYSGITTGDLYNNGLLDLIFVFNPGGGRPHEAHMYLNLGEGNFEHAHTFKNIDGYMAGLADLDLDGYLDIVFDGHPFVYLNNGNASFRKGPEIPVDGIDDPRAVAFADHNLDGKMDFAFAAKRSINRLYANRYSGPNRYLKIQLTAPKSVFLIIKVSCWVSGRQRIPMGIWHRMSQ